MTARIPLHIEISPGELFDRLTILEIKSDRLTDARQLHNVRRELTPLQHLRDRAFPDLGDLQRTVADLKSINAQLWQIEDDIRDCEARQAFGDTFVALARSVYLLNDRRAALKRAINDRLGSAIVEEKSYRQYGVT